jgi:hypothetical protein
VILLFVESNCVIVDIVVVVVVVVDDEFVKSFNCTISLLSLLLSSIPVL